jgi:hypothetical protein
VFTARYALSTYIKQIRFVFKGLIDPERIPVITAATGAISKSFRKYLSEIPGKYDIEKLYKRAILPTAHILRKAVR